MSDELIDGEVVDETAESQALTTPADRSIARLYVPHSTLAKAIDAFEEELGGRRALLEMLVGLPDGDDRLGYVVGLIADPRNDAFELSALCRAGGVSLGELLQTAKEGALAAAVVKALRKVAEKLPDVVEDVMLRAAPHQVTCDVCQGTGTRAAKPDAPPEPCPVCAGLGSKTVMPEFDRQKLALDLANLLPKKQPMIAIDARRQQANIGSLADLVKATDAVALRPMTVKSAPADPPTDPSST